MSVVVVVVLLMSGRLGLGRRLLGRLIALRVALCRGRIEDHAVKFHRLLGVSLKGRNKDANVKSQDRKTLHRSSPISALS